MAPEANHCAFCGEPLSPTADLCPSCGRLVARAAADDGGSSPATAPTRELGPGHAEIVRRIARLRQWGEASEPLHVAMPRLPLWAEEAARSSREGERWTEVLRGVERLAQQRVVQALEGWEKAARNRLVRLEAYSVDGRLERDQMEDLLRGARAGEVSQALASFQQVDRVVALKERHIDQARDELERIISLLRDMDALGLSTAHNPQEVSEDLERELRGGRLVALKQQLRALRLQAVSKLKTTLPTFVSDYGLFLQRERGDGLNVDAEVQELARSAKAFQRGNPEEALRRLRLLAQVHGLPPNRTARTTEKAEGDAASKVTEAAQTVERLP